MEREGGRGGDPLEMSSLSSAIPGSALSCLVQCCGFDPPLRTIFPVRGAVPLGINMSSDSTP